jgi:hypothetical protein
MKLSTLGVVSFYAVDSTEIITPETVEVLPPRGVPSLTLALCFMAMPRNASSCTRRCSNKLEPGSRTTVVPPPC